MAREKGLICIMDAVEALLEAYVGKPHRDRTRQIMELPEICRQSLDVMQFFILTWAGERIEHDEDESNPILAYDLEKEYNVATLKMKAMATSQESGALTTVDRKSYFALGNFLYKLEGLHYQQYLEWEEHEIGTESAS